MAVGAWLHGPLGRPYADSTEPFAPHPEPGAPGSRTGPAGNLPPTPSRPAMAHFPRPLGRGHCAETIAGAAGPTAQVGNCLIGDSGSWNARLSLLETLGDCVRRCHSCRQCSFVSYSHKARDCSWFRRCPIPLQQARQQGDTYRTVAVKPEEVPIGNATSYATPGQVDIALGFLSTAGFLSWAHQLGGTVHARAMRDAIRTWLPADVTEVAVRFLLAEIPPRLTGLTRNARAMAKAHEEAAEKRDMIFLPMNESRFRCGEKYLHWFVLGPRLFPSARWIAAADQDVYISVSHLRTDLGITPAHGLSYYGMLMWCATSRAPSARPPARMHARSLATQARPL